jgi:hypothetical protein
MHSVVTKPTSNSIGYSIWNEVWLAVGPRHLGWLMRAVLGTVHGMRGRGENERRTKRAMAGRLIRPGRERSYSSRLAFIENYRHPGTLA